MALKKNFAKAALGAEKKLNRSKTALSVLTPVFALAFGTTGMLTAQQIGHYDEGNEHQQAIFQQYEEVLSLLEEGRREYLAEHGSVLEEQARTAQITTSFEREVSAIFSFFGGDDEDEMSPAQQRAQEDWDSMKHFAGIFARDLHTDAKLAERDAQQLIARFENNVMPFSELGYQTPQAKDLRECQIRYDSAEIINNCTVEKDFTTTGKLALGGGIGVLLALLMGFGPGAAGNAVVRNRKRLEDWKNGKKNSGFKH